MDLLPQEAADFIYRLIGDASTIMISEELLSKANDDHVIIPGMVPKVERTVNEDGPLGLFPNGNNIEQAAERFLTETAMTVACADKIPEAEYMKRVTSLHSRFILIHPFPESNGRIGRNIINMMLSQIGRNFVLPKENKSKYLDLLDEMRTNMFVDFGRAKHKGRKAKLLSKKELSDSGYWTYMGNLADRPDRFVPQEIKHAGPLAEFIRDCNTLPIDTAQRKRKRHMFSLKRKWELDR